MRAEKDDEKVPREESEKIAVVLGMREVRAEAEVQGEAVGDPVEEEDAENAEDAVELEVDEGDCAGVAEVAGVTEREGVEAREGVA